MAEKILVPPYLRNQNPLASSLLAFIVAIEAEIAFRTCSLRAAPHCSNRSILLRRSAYRKVSFK